MPRGIRHLRRRRPAVPRKRRWRAALGALLLLLAVWLLWPAPDQPSPGTPPVQAAALKPEKPPEKPRLAKLAPAPPKPPQASPLLRARRDLLLAAVRARAASLRPCVPGDAAELRVPVRLHVSKTGAVKAVEFSGEAPSRQLGDCVRRVASGWNFQDVELPADVELFATLALSPGA
jgi:hypothetical protein